MELVYLYIKEYRSIKEKEFQFSASQIFEMEKSEEQYHLKLQESKKLFDENFFGTRIQNLTLVVGKNGAGKTTLFDFMRVELAEGYGLNIAQYCAIFKSEQDFYAKSNGMDVKKIGFNTNLFKAKKLPFLVYYSPIFDYSFESKFLTENIGNEVRNFSDNALIISDFERNSIEGNLGIMASTLADSINTHVHANEIREIDFFLTENATEIPKSHRLAISFIETRELWTAELKRCEDAMKNGKLGLDDLAYMQSYALFLSNLIDMDRKNPEVGAKEKREYRFYQHLTLNLFFDFAYRYRQGWDQIKDIKKTANFTDNGEVSSLFLTLSQTNLGKSDYLQALDDLIKLNMSSNDISENAQLMKVFLLGELKAAFEREERFDSALRDIQEIFETPKRSDYHLKLNFRHFEKETKSFLWAMRKIKPHNLLFTRKISDLDENYVYSTGELHFVKLFSRLLFAFEELKKENAKSVMLLLDEAELGMHPEWQQKFIYWLTNFVNKNLHSTMKIQIVVSTHSPLMLSDLPMENVIRLSTQNQEYVEMTKTFGANLYDLLNSSFFLSEGFIGEFAKNKINSLIGYIERGKPEDENWDKKRALIFIDLIGEPLIQNELREMFFRAFYDEEQIDNEIDRLEKIKVDKRKEQ